MNSGTAATPIQVRGKEPLIDIPFHSFILSKDFSDG
jgi:hypothetical protein